MGDIDKCFETWKKFRKYVKGSQNASKLFDSYFDHDKGDSSSIQGGLSCTASDIQQGNIWSGDTANAASDKILELLQEQKNIERDIEAIQDQVRSYCDKKAEEWQRAVAEGERDLNTLEEVSLLHKKKKYMANGG